MSKYICIAINGEVIGRFDSIVQLNHFIVTKYIDKPYYVSYEGKMIYNENGYWLVKEGGVANV